MYKLQVAGSGTFGYIPGSKDGIFLHGSDSYGAPCVQALSSSAGTNTLTINPAGGFVGIGITNPEGPLQVHSAIRTSDRSLNGGAGVTLTTSAGAGYGSIECYNTANTTKLPIVFQNWGGNVGIGVTNPSFKLEVAGMVKARDGFISWSTEFFYAAGTPTWNPGDAGNWPVGGYKFLITLMGHPGLGGTAVRGTYIVYHSRWAAGNNNFGMITPIGTPQWVSATAITDGGMSFTFNSPSAQMVYINVMAI